MALSSYPKTAVAPGCACERRSDTENANRTHAMSETDIHAAFGPNHDPSRLDRDRGCGRNLLLRCHHNRHEQGCLVRRQRQQMLRYTLLGLSSQCHCSQIPRCGLLQEVLCRRRISRGSAATPCRRSSPQGVTRAPLSPAHPLNRLPRGSATNLPGAHLRFFFNVHKTP